MLNVINRPRLLKEEEFCVTQGISADKSRERRMRQEA